MTFGAAVPHARRAALRGAVLLAAACAAPAAGAGGEPRVVAVTRVPAGFVGHLAYEAASGRLWLLSFGPPANPAGASRLYELDAGTGAVLAEAALPFAGSFGPPAAVDGDLYVGIFWESRIYRLSTARQSFGAVVATLPVPGVAELGMERDGRYRYPFLEFSGLAVTPEKHLLLYANRAGELITLARDGTVVSRVPTLRGLGALAGVAADGRFLLLANQDAEDFTVREKVVGFDLRPAVVPVLTKRSRWGSFAARAAPKQVSWLLLDAADGAALARVDDADSPAFAAGTAIVRREAVAGAPYGRLSFLALGADGILTLEWTPGGGPG